VTPIVSLHARGSCAATTWRAPYVMWRTMSDHGVASEATIRARQLASGAGVASGFRTITPPALLLFEPHQPELCGFVPTTFLDITPVWEQKVAAMEAMGAQDYLRQYYAERAAHRANHARRISGRAEIRYAEAFQRDIPQVVDAL